MAKSLRGVTVGGISQVRLEKVACPICGQRSNPGFPFFVREDKHGSYIFQAHPIAVMIADIIAKYGVREPR